MMKLLSCNFNMDTNRVEAKFADGVVLAIDCLAIEDEYGNTPAQRAGTGLAAVQQTSGVCTACAEWRDRTLPLPWLRPWQAGRLRFP